jgi:excisionase family DNA binding protein
MPAVPGGRPARPAGRHQGRLPLPPATAGARRRSPPGTRARTCRPSPPAGPGRPPLPAAPRRPPVRLFLFPCFPGPAAPGHGLPSAWRGPDLTRRAERSVRRRGPTDRPPPGTPIAPGRPPATPDGAPGTPGDPLLTIEEVTADLRVSRAAFYRWRRQGAGPPAVRLPGGGVRVRRSALSQWLRRLEEQDTQDEQEQTADGQLRRQVLGHQEARQRQHRTVPGRVGSGRARALQVVQGPPRRRVPHRPQGRGPRPAALQPPHRPARHRGHRGGDGHLVRPCPSVRRGQVGRPRPGLAPVGRRGTGHRHRRPFREGAGRARGQGAAAPRCSPGRSTPPPATPARPRRSQTLSTGPSAPPCPSPNWRTQRSCGSRWPPAPRP